MLDCCLCIQELIGSLSHSVIPLISSGVQEPLPLIGSLSRSAIPLIGSGVQEPLPLSGATSSASSFQLPAVHLQVFIRIIFILN